MTSTGKTGSVRTSTLLNRIFKTSNIMACIKANEPQMNVPAFSAYITALCDGRGFVPQRVIAKADIENSYGHQLFKGSRKPSRDTVIKLAFGFDADVELTQEMLKYARAVALYPRVKRDAVIIYCLKHHLRLLDTQALLQELELPLLGGERT